MAQQSGSTGLFQVYSQSKITLGSHLSLNAGIHSSYFLLNKKVSVEPRLGLKYEINEKQNIAIAYGAHSRIERLPIYFVDQNGDRPNNKLEMMTSYHYVLGYNVRFNDNLRLSVEPYYQYLSRVPVSPDGYISTINMKNDIFFNEHLISAGNGRNVGIDVTVERFLHKGFYYLLTASVFDSKYEDANGTTRNTRFNKNYVFNVLGGKEWVVGKNNNNIFSASARLNYLGGNRREPIDSGASLLEEEVVYGENNGEQRAFSQKFDDTPVLSLVLSYRKNKSNYSSVWSLQILNATSAEEYSNDYYDLKSGKIETNYEGIMVPNLSYKIEF